MLLGIIHDKLMKHGHWLYLVLFAADNTFEHKAHIYYLYLTFCQ